MNAFDWSDFIAMGGYGFYVWTAYGLTLAVLGWLLILPFVRQRQLRREQQRQQRRQQRKQEMS